MRTAGRRRRVLVAMVVVALGLGLTGCKRDPGQAARDRIVFDHNGARAFAGIPFLSTEGNAAAYAQQVAERMRDESGDRNCVLRHSTPDEMSARYPGRSWGENIGCYSGCANAAGSATPAFVRSPTHRRNILNASFSLIGVGAACNGRYLFVAVHFAS